MLQFDEGLVPAKIPEAKLRAIYADSPRFAAEVRRYQRAVASTDRSDAFGTKRS